MILYESFSLARLSGDIRVSSLGGSVRHSLIENHGHHSYGPAQLKPVRIVRDIFKLNIIRIFNFWLGIALDLSKTHYERMSNRWVKRFWIRTSDPHRFPCPNNNDSNGLLARRSPNKRNEVFESDLQKTYYRSRNENFIQMNDVHADWLSLCSVTNKTLSSNLTRMQTMSIQIYTFEMLERHIRRSIDS